jgi:hypothetical protein
MTFELLGLQHIYGPRTPHLRRTHDLPGLGLSAQTSSSAQHNEPRQALAYEGQEST